tara:strand:+ start:435 stop:704 length:270 start_codon:yes stop_codon:yes gene_type:complete
MSKDVKELLAAAKKGVVTVEFTKVGTGEVRIMPCTLDVILSKHNVPEILEQKEDNDHIVVWSMDKEAWRSFRTSTVIRWYEGYPTTTAE